jgi:hypothetical protein
MIVMPSKFSIVVAVQNETNKIRVAGLRASPCLPSTVAQMRSCWIMLPGPGLVFVSGGRVIACGLQLGGSGGVEVGAYQRTPGVEVRESVTH